MVRINFKGSNIGEGEFREIEIQDNAEQVAKRNERYIEDLKTNRDAQTAIDSQYIIDAEKALRGEEQSQSEEAKRQLNAARTIADQQIRSLQAQAKEIESITGRKANITGKGDQKVDSWVDFVTANSVKAAEMYQGVRQAENAFQWDQGIAKAHMFGATWDDVAWNRRWGDAAIIGASKDELAAIAQANGADSTYVEQLRSGNNHFLNATKHSLATDMLKSSTAMFQKALKEDGETEINLRTQDGTVLKIPLNQIDAADATQVQQAYYQWLPDHIRQQGFGDASSEFLNSGLQLAKQDYDTMIGQIRTAEITKNDKERLEGSLKIFHTQQNSISFKGAVVTAQNVNPALTSNEAHEAVIQGMGDLVNFPDQSKVDAILDNTIVAGGATLRQAYGGAVQKMLDSRVQAQEDRYSKNETSRALEEKGQIDKLLEGVDADRADDGQLNQINNEQLEDIAVRATQEGKTNLANTARSLKTQTVDGIRQASLVQSWDEILKEGGALDPRMVIQSGVDDATQEKYIKLANESIAIAVPEERLEFFKGIAEKRLKLRVKHDYTKEDVMHESVDFALQNALAEYKRDFTTALKSGKSEAEAADYAQRAFYDELKDVDGQYAVADVTPGGTPYPAFLPKEFKPVDDITASFATKFQAEGNAAYRIPHEDLRPGIQASLTKLQNFGTFEYPEAINKMALMSGGKYSALDVYRMQADALGIPLVPAFQQAQQVETEVGPAYQKFIKYKPNSTRTDITAIGNGDEPIYNPTALGEQVKSIVGKRESPAAGYDAINRGVGGDTPGGGAKFLGRPLTDMTVAEVMRYQNLPLDDPKGIFAVGKYQFIPTTLAAAVKRAGIDPNMKFNQAVQDRIFFVHLDDNGLYGPWERWWIEQGGPGLATTAEEKEIIRRFREEYDPADPWNAARNQNPAVVKHKIKTEAGQ